MKGNKYFAYNSYINQERNRDFAKWGALKWKILWRHFDDVFSAT